MAHLNYYLDFTIAVFVVDRDCILLVHHRALERWLPLGGHIDPGEDPITALHREAREESGLEIELLLEKPLPQLTDVQVLPPPVFMDIHPITGQHHHLGMVYFARPISGELRLSETEHHAIRWFTQQELLDAPPEMIPENVRFYAREALKRAQLPVL
jgi:8-oxo-dGTP pyrophosphatase MutT (NUDIX family)